MNTLFCLFIFHSLQAQTLEYLNKHHYPIYDTNRFTPAFYKITMEDSLSKFTRIFSTDSSLVYQNRSVRPDTLSDFSSTEIWFYESGKRKKVSLYRVETDLKELVCYYESGQIESKVSTQGGNVVFEEYFSKTGEPVDKPEIIEAQPKDGITGWNKYLGKNLVYPISARRMGFEGLIYLVFIINEKGEMEEVEIKNPEENHFLLNQEAMRVTKAYPYLWTPMIVNGKPVKSSITLPIRFKLTG